MNTSRSLEEQRAEYRRKRFLAMPIAGTVAWFACGIAGLLMDSRNASIFIFIATGMIAYLGIFNSKFTGENFTDRNRPKNEFDRLFFYGAGMAILVYSIAIPFFLKDHTSLPLTVGILTGLMWIPFSWIIQHWVGLFHTLVRTAVILVAWYALPSQRFVVIPFLIVAIYLVTIGILEARWRKENSA